MELKPYLSENAKTSLNILQQALDEIKDRFGPVTFEGYFCVNGEAFPGLTYSPVDGSDT